MCAKIGDKDYNFKKVKHLASQIEQTDVLVLPEVWSIGWDCQSFRNNAELLENSETISFLSQLAKEKSTNIIGGSFITRTENGKYFNTCPIINRKGELVTTYNKLHLYSYYGCNEGKYVTRGDDPLIVNLENINFGITICYDIRFPEIYRAYRKAGADVLINCAAWASTKPIPWEMMTKSRAIENQTYFIAVNQYGEMKNNEFNLGHSRIIDYNGNVLSELLDGEGIIQSNLDLEEMYNFRDKCTVLDDIRESYEVKLYE